MRDAISTKDLPSKQKQDADTDSLYPPQLRALATKTWDQLTDQDKDLILKHLALRMGLVKKDP